MIFHVFANRSNIGDWLSAKGIQSLLAPYTVTECLCDKPFVKETIEILHSATRNDLIIVGGGGLFMDYFIPFWKKFRIIAERIPFFIWGVGCCDIKHENSIPPLSIIGKIIERSKLCIVRDEITKNFLSGFKIPSPVACPAVNIIEPIGRAHV